MAARPAGIAALALALVAAGAQARSSGPTLTVPPSITGTAKAGSRLTAGTGTWTSATPVSYGYQWYRCDSTGAHCSSIHGATAPALTLSAKDVGQTIALTVTASDATGSTSAYASLVGPIATKTPLLVSTAQPLIVGAAVQGKPLQVTTGAWSPMPTRVTYSWRRCNVNGRICRAIAGADGSAYVVSGSDVGHALVALVQAKFGTSTQDALSTASSAAIGDDIAGPTHSAPPAISGTVAVGSRLLGSAGVWAGVGSVAYAYQWYRCDQGGAHCSSVHGATKATYRSVPADEGKTLGFTVRATDSTGTAAAYSNLVGPVAPARAPLVSGGAAALTGSAHPGATLTTDPGGWQPPPEKLSYEWRRCNANGRICIPIAGATQPSYVVAAADVGHVLVAVVTAHIGSTTQAAYGDASQPVR